MDARNQPNEAANADDAAVFGILGRTGQREKLKQELVDGLTEAGWFAKLPVLADSLLARNQKRGAHRGLHGLINDLKLEVTNKRFHISLPRVVVRTSFVLFFVVGSIRPRAPAWCAAFAAVDAAPRVSHLLFPILVDFIPRLPVSIVHRRRVPRSPPSCASASNAVSSTCFA